MEDARLAVVVVVVVVIIVVVIVVTLIIRIITVMATCLLYDSFYLQLYDNRGVSAAWHLEICTPPAV